ncbi:hypothetical protein [Dankookia sp. P2]|uniref:hypothetical protein n=1 Tax=Dankookia sp. P2 TaxID=3423955 RepID=UPI003D665049
MLAGLTGPATLIPFFHLLRTAALLRERGFSVAFDGLAEDAPYDLLVERGGARAEVVCESVSAEEGRPVNRGDWWALVDAINPGLQTWLAAHPGRYLLKMTLPEGISGPDQLAELQQRISAMLVAEKRQDSGAQAVLKLDPLMLAGAQAQDHVGSGLPARLRAHSARKRTWPSLPSPAAAVSSPWRRGRGGRTRSPPRSAAAPSWPPRPGFPAGIRDPGDLPRRSRPAGLARPARRAAGARRGHPPLPHHAAGAARSSRSPAPPDLEMFGGPDAVPEGELRFRNPGHAAAKHSGLAPAILSSV